MAVFLSHFKLALPSPRGGWRLWVTASTITSLIGAIVFTSLFLFVFQNKFYPGVVIDQQPVGGKTKTEAIKNLEEQSYPKPTGQITLQAEPPSEYNTNANLTLTIDSNQLVKGRNFNQATSQAFEYGRSGSLLQRAKEIIQGLAKDQSFSTHWQVNKEVLGQKLEELSQRLNQPARKPTATLSQSSNLDSLQIDPGVDGLAIEIETQTEAISEKLTRVFETDSPASQALILVPITPQQVTLTTTQVEQFKEAASLLVGKSVVFSNKANEKLKESQINLDREPIIKKVLNDQDLISLISPRLSYNDQAINQTTQQWSEELRREPTNAQFEYDSDTLGVIKFTPQRRGIELDQKHTIAQIKQVISHLTQGFPPHADQEMENDLETTGEEGVYHQKLVLKTSEPEVTLAETNDLGINQLIGFGDSYYAHSIPSRIHNVKITADKLSLTIVPPGEKFSFNQAIGEVSRATGYQPAYVIRGGRTVLGDGGGVCQVSTTLFRALLDSGLEITRRLPHSYRVSYYELDKKPGFDATVYSGNVDLRFINDTDQHILIYSQASSDDLYMKVEIYGSDDGRTTNIVDYRQWGYQPPPAPQYIPDNSLAPGQIKQVDWSASGIKAEFTHIVKDAKGEVIREKTYYSSYRPWSAKYLKGI